jgi:hypothetical protein
MSSAIRTAGKAALTLLLPFTIAVAHAEEPAAIDQLPAPTIDTNHDGKADAWDLDANGTADAWDTNADGKPDAFDKNGDGKPDSEPTKR